MSHDCANELCARQASQSEYCCPPCKLAANKRYEIHEGGLLGHTAACTRMQGADKAFYKTVGIDFDGVVHQYNGWCDVENQPIPGAFEGIRELHKNYNLFIFCARERGDAVSCLDRIPHWFAMHELGIEVVCPETHGHFWNDRRILVTNMKLPAVAYIDDRAIRFQNWTQTLSDMEVLHG